MRACVRVCVCVLPACIIGTVFTEFITQYKLWTQIIHQGHPPQNGLGLTRHITTTASTDSSGALCVLPVHHTARDPEEYNHNSKLIAHIYQRQNVLDTVLFPCHYAKSFLSMKTTQYELHTPLHEEHNTCF